jgi:hypothetical protein
VGNAVLATGAYWSNTLYSDFLIHCLSFQIIRPSPTLSSFSGCGFSGNTGAGFYACVVNVFLLSLSHTPCARDLNSMQKFPSAFRGFRIFTHGSQDPLGLPFGATASIVSSKERLIKSRCFHLSSLHCQTRSAMVHCGHQGVRCTRAYEN